MLLTNSLSHYRTALDAADLPYLDAAAAAEAERFFRRHPHCVPTPLHSLPSLAAETGVGAIHIKDEGARLGLGSFKALGGAYAVARLVAEHAGDPAAMTFVCATDGNHGRSVAAGAQHAGARSRVFVHAGVSEERIAAIAAFGADIVRVAGNYDDAVAAARACIGKPGCWLVADTAWPGYERVPGIIMQGYSVLLGEALQAMAQPPSHVFVQAGVGGLAAALAGRLALLYGENRPRFVVVEPARAACLLASVQAGRAVKIAPAGSTIMAMLECYEPSLSAWRILSRCADAFMTVDEDAALAVMRRLARPGGADPAIVAGESGGVGLAGFLAAAGNAAGRRAIGLGTDSRVLVINTEGATDPARYRELLPS